MRQVEARGERDVHQRVAPFRRTGEVRGVKDHDECACHA
jgi:hypothetical protein